ncbi:MAG: substrate-binding domain-containing protein, partial [Planctomycetota bacterium]
MSALTRMSDRIARTGAIMVACLSLLLVAGLAGCDGQQDGGSAGGGGGGAQDKLQIAVIPKGTAHPYWKAVHGGAAKAAGEMDLNIIWNGPPSERARQQQIEIVQNYTARGVDGIVLAPLDSTALVRPVETAVRRG